MRIGINPLIRGSAKMLNDRNRLLELALESLEGKKKQIDEEIAEVTRELRGKRGVKGTFPKAKNGAQVRAPKKRARFSRKERLRRSQRMKEYWENWRKKKSRIK
jgi:hypothetical protein